MNYFLVQRRDVQAQTTWVHYRADNGSWAPEPAGAKRYSYQAARSLAAQLNWSARQWGRWSLKFVAVREKEVGR